MYSYKYPHEREQERLRLLLEACEAGEPNLLYKRFVELKSTYRHETLYQADVNPYCD